MTEKFSRWDNADYLKTEEDVALYLQACIDEDPGDGSLVRAALGDIARAEGMSQVAQELGRQWKSLGEDERATYEQRATDDKDRYARVWKLFNN